MAIEGIIFDMGHTLMHLDGTWPEMFEQGARDLVLFLEKHEPSLDAEVLARTWLERRTEGYARAQATMALTTHIDRSTGNLLPSVAKARAKASQAPSWSFFE